jgi:Holliday junction resolvase RusA-like endonuclease
MAILFTIPGLPIAQPRQRHRVVAMGGRVIAQNYTPTKSPVNVFKAGAQQAFAAVYSGPPLEGPLVLTVLAVFPRPKRLIWKSKPMPRQYHTCKPDADNLAKALKDALTSLAWKDDCQVSILRVAKVYGRGDEQPRVEVGIQQLKVVGGESLGFVTTTGVGRSDLHVSCLGGSGS